MSVRWPLLAEGRSANVTELLAMAAVGDVLAYTLQSAVLTSLVSSPRETRPNLPPHPHHYPPAGGPY